MMMTLNHPSELTKLLLCASIMCLALFVAWRYLRHKPAGEATPFEKMLGDRPWRRLGAGIALVLAIMFVAGVYVVDIPDRPRPYAVYWIIMLALVVWLCALAVKDALHTRRTYRQWRSDRNGAPGP